jgi:DNA-binding GntR family transcriptional regulator
MNDFRANDSLSEQIARHIGNQIVSGELKAGDRIQELRIASELNVSRGSVREAYLILERRYLIEIMPRKGAVVAQLTPSHVKNIFELYFYLLGLLLRDLSQKWQADDLQAFAGLSQEMMGMVDRGDTRGFHEATFAFVHLAYRFTDNAYLIELLGNLQPAIARAFYLLINTSHDEMKSTMECQRNTMDGVARRDALAAAQAAQSCGNHLADMVIKHLK